MVFKYSNDNKRYHTANYYYQTRFKNKIFRIPVDAGFTCPNRDHKLGFMGCSFCSIAGSGDLILKDQIEAQIEDGFKIMRHKWPNGKALLYFQAYTNTYDSLENLIKLYEPYRFDNRFEGIIIATRPDCLEPEKIKYFSEFNKDKPIWIELGLQTIHESTSNHVNRGHTSQVLFDVLKQCKENQLFVCVHIINGLPYETKEMMIDTVKTLAKYEPDGIKIHMFHLLKNTLEAYRYKQSPYPILTRDEYVEIVCNQLRYLNPKCVIFRLTGDGPENLLIGPEWTKKKTIVLNEIDKKMKKENIVQGDLYGNK